MYINIYKDDKEFKVPVVFKNELTEEDDLAIILLKYKNQSNINDSKEYRYPRATNACCDCYCPLKPEINLCCGDETIDSNKLEMYAMTYAISIDNKGFPIFSTPVDIKQGIYRVLLYLNNELYCCENIYLQIKKCF